MKRCIESGCRRKTGGRSNYCNHCRHEREKQKNPLRYAFGYHRRNARRRGHAWTLSFEQFQALWEANPKKMAEKIKCLRGELGHTCTWEIDRINPERGYEPGNVRIIDKITNIRFQWDYQRGEGDFAIDVTRITPESTAELRSQVPF